MAKFFRFPWATQGDKVSTPDALQSDGSCSWLQGFGFDYERPNTDANYKPIPRDGMNGILHDLSEAIGELQRQGAPSYTPQAAPYVGGALVRHAGANWLSTVDDNRTEPGAVGSKWVQFGVGADVGDVKTVATENAPYGWLKCNGGAVSRSDYPALFEVIGTSFGAGDGSTTFNLPDLRGEFVRGWDDGRRVDIDRGLGTSQGQQLSSHAHTASVAAGGTHGHAASSSAQGHHSHTGVSSAGGEHSHYTGTLGNNTGYTVGWLAAGGASSFAGHYVGNAGHHQHTLHIDGNGSHSHNIFITAGGEHSHTVDIEPNGGAENRPRNVSLLYVIKY